MSNSLDSQKKKIVAMTDGGARGNPGPAAIGVYIADQSGKELARFGRRIGESTNNTAEYLAVIAALLFLKEKWGQGNFSEVGKVEFLLDSNLVVNQLNGNYKIKQKHLMELALRVKSLEKEIGASIIYRHIPREQNRTADLLVNQALD